MGVPKVETKAYRLLTMGPNGLRLTFLYLGSADCVDYQDGRLAIRRMDGRFHYVVAAYSGVLWFEPDDPPLTDAQKDALVGRKGCGSQDQQSEPQRETKHLDAVDSDILLLSCVLERLEQQMHVHRGNMFEPLCVRELTRLAEEIHPGSVASAGLAVYDGSTGPATASVTCEYCRLAKMTQKGAPTHD